MNKEIGAILLIAGCCIGAGMLGLPVLSGLTGFTPSLILLVFSWLFMVCTGLLLLEVNLWFKDDVSIITMADKTLGFWGKLVGWVGFLFLFYALMVAYIEGTGELLSDLAEETMGAHFPPWVGSVWISVVFGLMVTLGTWAVDWFNRIFMVGLIATYGLLAFMGAKHVQIENLQHSNWSMAYLVIPAMIISFGYHNLIPTLKTYLGGNVSQLKKVIFWGSAIPLIIYMIWEALILGLVPEKNFSQALDQGDMATRALRNAVRSPWVVEVAQGFAFFAIVTSFLGVALSFVDFLADGLGIKKDLKGKIFLCFLVVAIPLAFALIYPKLFLIALSYAGSFGAVSLFGILPAAMVWAGRYRQKLGGEQIVPGGKGLLIVIIAISILIMLLQLVQDVGT